MASDNHYALPSSPTRKCIDRFSIVDLEEDDDGQVPFWPILVELLSAEITSPTNLIDLLETIAVTLHGSSGLAGDYAILRRFLASRPDLFETKWPILVKIALRMPELFSSNTLPVLGRGRAVDSIELNQKQVACLVLHQFLCTVEAPSWKDDGMHNFAIWYGSEQRHENAVLAYLEALFLYFDKIVNQIGAFEAPEDNWAVQYTMRDFLSLNGIDIEATEPVQLSELNIQIVEKYSTDPLALGLPKGACVVSANRSVGFGQSATQEEIHVGCSPEACPVVLITPPLQDDQILIVKGAEAMVNMTGQRRDIAVEPQQRLRSATCSWKDRSMLFMDALEIDMISPKFGLPDLQPGNVSREIKKAAIAFSSGSYDEVLVGLWGCGAFCGDPGVKMSALWCAASLASVKLCLVFDKSQRVFADDYAVFASKARVACGTMNRLKGLLDLAPATLARHATLEWLTGQLHESA